MSSLSLKCNVAYYPNELQPPKEGVTNVDTRLHRPIYKLNERQFHSKILLYT